MSTGVAKWELCVTSKEGHPWMGGVQRWHHGVDILCSPVKGQTALNFKTNVNQNVKIWLVLHLEMVTEVGEGEA